MAELPISAPRQALVEFSRKNLDAHAVMRTFAEHNDWLAPAIFLAQAYNMQNFENIAMFGQQTALPPGEVWLFTEMATAMRAQEAGALLGPYEGGIWGGNLFVGWQPEWGVVKVNPGSPAEETLTIQPDGTDLLSMWAGVIRLEAVFAGGPKVKDKELHRALMAFQDYILLIDIPTNEPVFYKNRDYERAMLAFTSPDNVAEFLDVFAGKRGQFKTISVGAEKLFRIMAAFKMDAISFNQYATSPGYECPASILKYVLPPG